MLESETENKVNTLLPLWQWLRGADYIPYFFEMYHEAKLDLEEKDHLAFEHFNMEMQINHWQAQLEKGK